MPKNGIKKRKQDPNNDRKSKKKSFIIIMNRYLNSTRQSY